MPQLDLVHNSDLAIYGQNGQSQSTGNNGNNGNNGMIWGPPCQCPPFPPPPPFYPPLPPCPVPPPAPQPEPEPEPKKNSTEGQICKLSKKAAVINRMIDNLNNKKKDVIIKIGDASYNFGNIDTEITGWADGSYAATILPILQDQLSRIQAEIKKLADELDDTEEAVAGVETAITG